MLSLDFVCQYPEIVQEGLRRRRSAQSIDEILRLAELRRGLITRCDGLYIELKRLQERSQSLPEKQAEELDKQIKANMQDIRQLEMQCSETESRLDQLLLELPNVPHPAVPEGEDDQELRRWGAPLAFHFTPQPHWELSERLGLTDFAAGEKVSGSHFVVLKGLGARLERALIMFLLDLHTREHGYTEILPPYLVKRAMMQGAGELPAYENQAYVCTEDELYLNPTAEVPLVGLHSEEVLTKERLPLRYVAWTTAFRREPGPVFPGLLRLHQYNHIELFQLVEPRESYKALDAMLGHAETALRLLELPYRVTAACAKNLPFSAARTMQLEVWMAAQEQYVEVSSISNCEAFQGCRANIRYRLAGSRSDYVHTLHGAALGVERVMAALLEAYQQADGSVIVPKVLRPYMAASLLTNALERP